METTICSNFNTCRLVNAEDYKIDPKQKELYIETYCKASIEKWSTCKRFITKKELSFCPDFVLPNTKLSLDEIIDKFDDDDTLQ